MLLMCCTIFFWNYTKPCHICLRTVSYTHLDVYKRQEYILHEEQAPTEQGYVRAEDVKFIVEETGEVQKVEMKDDHTRV